MDMIAQRAILAAASQIDYLCGKHGHPSTWTVIPGQVKGAALIDGEIRLDCKFDSDQDGVVEVRDQCGVPFYEFEVSCKAGQMRRLRWREI